MWELIDIFIAVGLVAFGAVAIGALLYLDARNERRFNRTARSATTTEQSEVPPELNDERSERAQAPRHSVAGTSPTRS
jgi:hypothetical protein